MKTPMVKGLLAGKLLVQSGVIQVHSGRRTARLSALCRIMRLGREQWSSSCVALSCGSFLTLVAPRRGPQRAAARSLIIQALRSTLVRSVEMCTDSNGLRGTLH